MYVVDKSRLIDFRRVGTVILRCFSMSGCDKCDRELRKECDALGGIEMRDEQLVLWLRYILNRLEELDMNLLDVPDDEFMRLLG